MALANINTNYTIPGYAQLYLAEYPVAGYTGDTTADKVDAAYELFYTDGAARKALKTGVYEWGFLSGDGLSVKIKGEPVKVKANGMGEYPIAYANFSAELEGAIFDCNSAHVKDMFGVESGDIITTAAASGIAGRETLLIGGQKLIKTYVAMARLQSPVTGEFEHYFFPRVKMSAEDVELAMKDAEVIKMKFKLTAFADSAFPSAVTGAPNVLFVDNVKSAAL